MKCYVLVLFQLITIATCGQNAGNQSCGRDSILSRFKNPPESAKPWAFWYWMRGAVSKEGITTDLEAMKKIGIAGAYLVPILEPTNPPIIEPVVNVLSAEWWEMLAHAFREAKSLGIQLAMHTGDGFATAGGPWITPELSMQKMVWSEIQVDGNAIVKDSFPVPLHNENYYRDIALLAFLTPKGRGVSTKNIVPKITTQYGADASFLIKEHNSLTLKSDTSCWIQYEFDEPFTCRSIITSGATYNYQSHRLRVETSNDGINFRLLSQLAPSRNGWLDWDADYTHAVPEVTARYYRFYYNKEGSEPGAEDNDMAKFKPTLKLKGLQLSSAATIHQYEGKSGLVWRVANPSKNEPQNDSLFVDIKNIINITDRLHNGVLNWISPPGKWTVLRIGYTTTGHKNLTAGGGKGLECDKFNPLAVQCQFDNWFGKIQKQIGGKLTSEVLKIIHTDSWECGSQNWSPVFMAEFIKRRGYDPTLFLPAMAGIPLQNTYVSEKFLHDIRLTIAELISENYFGTMAGLAHTNGYLFSAEAVAPVATSDGMLHYKTVDIPMGEFWVNSPTHDKPTDVVEAVSAAHIYGKNIVQSEAFTTLRMDWDEHPAMLKSIGDRNFALGVNKFVLHVFCHNPKPAQKPGMTLGPTGLFFQPSQTWWEPGKFWIDYIQKCQSLLQFGVPVTDIAVFTGEEIPSRALLPEHLTQALPGLFSKERLALEKKRLNNSGVPMRNLPDGVTNSANTSDPGKWVDALQGYKFDSFNTDALIRLAYVKDGNVVFGNGSTYKLLVLPGKTSLNPLGNVLPAETIKKIIQLVKDGASVVVNDTVILSGALHDTPETQSAVVEFYKLLANPAIGNKIKGNVLKGPIVSENLNNLGVEKDVIVSEKGKLVNGTMAWTHRRNKDQNIDIYFVSNQLNTERVLDFSFRADGRIPEIWNPNNSEIADCQKWHSKHGRTEMPLKFQPYESFFIVFTKVATNEVSKGQNWVEYKVIGELSGPWDVYFPGTKYESQSIVFNQLTDWSLSEDTVIRYFSGTAMYKKAFDWQNASDSSCLIDLGETYNIAAMKLNGRNIGTVWTAPFRSEIIIPRKGANLLEIEVTNTWLNRLIGDSKLPENLKESKSVFPPYRIGDKKLQKAGLLGPVRLKTCR